MKRLLFAVLLFVTLPAYASITLVQSAHSSANSATTVAVTASGVVATDTLIIEVGGNSGATVPTSIVDSSGNTVTAAVTYATTGSHSGVGIYFVQNASAGAHTITCTWGAANSGTIFVAEYSGLATSSVFDTASAISFAANTSIATASITPAGNGELLIFAVAQQGNAVYTYSGYTNGFVQKDALSGTGLSPQSEWAQLIQATAASINAGVTSSSTAGSAAAIAAFKPTSGASCTHQGFSSGGALAIPNGSSGSYLFKSGAFGTPDCSTVNYWQTSQGNFGVN